MLRDWGAERKYQHVLKGYNYRMEGFQGAILRVKLRHLDKWTKARRDVAQFYNELLHGSNVQTPVEMPYARHVYHIYAIRTLQRSVLQQDLQSQGVQTGIHYPIPVHLLPAYTDLGYHQGNFPLSEEACDQVLSLPIFAELSKDQIQTVCDAVSSTVKV
jgi:dTDP-4-amino-4,6-dideoxygalactose transaminase